MNKIVAKVIEYICNTTGILLSCVSIGLLVYGLSGGESWIMEFINSLDINVLALAIGMVGIALIVISSIMHTLVVIKEHKR